MKPEEKLSKFEELLKYRIISIRNYIRLFEGSDNYNSVRSYEEHVCYEIEWLLEILSNDKRLEELVEFCDKHLGGEKL